MCCMIFFSLLSHVSGVFKLFLRNIPNPATLSWSHNHTDEMQLTSVDFSIRHSLRFFAFGCREKEESGALSSEKQAAF